MGEKQRILRLPSLSLHFSLSGSSSLNLLSHLVFLSSLNPEFSVYVFSPFFSLSIYTGSGGLDYRLVWVFLSLQVSVCGHCAHLSEWVLVSIISPMHIFPDAKI